MKERAAARRETAGHADDWLMTYADMITLLLCFFAIFLSIALPKKDVAAKIEVPPTAAAAPVRQVLVLNARLPFPDRLHEDEASSEVAVPAAAAGAELPEIVPPPELAAAPASPEPSEIQPKGDRITMLEMGSAAFFDSGSATLSAAGQSILAPVAADLASSAFDGYRITVEGHTDDEPIKTAQFPSNWELSTARAAAVVHYLLDHGVAAARLRAAGYADTFPRAPNRDARGNAIAENQAQNRRVVITLEKIEKAGAGTAAP